LLAASRGNVYAGDDDGGDGAGPSGADLVRAGQRLPLARSEDPDRAEARRRAHSASPDDGDAVGATATLGGVSGASRGSVVRTGRSTSEALADLRAPTLSKMMTLLASSASETRALRRLVQWLVVVVVALLALDVAVLATVVSRT
jgi:hypothetical protein